MIQITVQISTATTNATVTTIILSAKTILSDFTLPSVKDITCIKIILFRLPFLAHLSRSLKGELIVYQSSRRLSVCLCVCESVCLCVCLSVNIFKFEYLRNQWANRNQILSEASLGRGNGCIRFWTRSDQNSGVHGNR